MRKREIFGILLLGTIGCTVAGCSSDKSNNTSGSGGTSNGGAGATGGKGGGADAGGGDSGTNNHCGDPSMREYDQDGGLMRIGATDPSKSLALDVGAFYAMPSTNYHGYCYTIADNYTPTGSTTPTGSNIYPPCGDTGPCFTVDTRLCVVADLGVASGSDVWGAGIGCNLSQVMGGTYIGRTSLTGMKTVTVGVYGCEVPSKLQVQLNMHFGTGPALVDGGTNGSGYMCKVVTVPPADANGVHTITVPLTDLAEDCWNDGTPHLDPETMQVEAVAIQINADQAKRTTWDFCVSRLSIE